MCRILHGWTGVLFYAWYMVETVPKIIFVSLRNSQSHKLTESGKPAYLQGLKARKGTFGEFVSKLFEKLSIYISFFIIFFNIFQVTFIKLHSQTHKIEKTG